MARLLSIDYGTKRTGIAITDELQIIATPLTTVKTCELAIFLTHYFEKENVSALVIGMPKNTNGKDTHASPRVKSFVNECKKKFPQKKIILHDERFTSKMAFDTLLKGGMKKQNRKKKENIDKISATIILQSFMESNL